ncbi:MAG: hypothetical protein MZV70_28680 [Desulfobacterales bacterium]|nr:hypothetical protein [Desulfobacterales bacterium]
MDALTILQGPVRPSRPISETGGGSLPRGCILEDGGRVLVAVLATGPNFNTNFASLGLPVPVFGRGDSSTLHIPGSDALGIVVDAGAAVKTPAGRAGGHPGFLDRPEHHPRLRDPRRVQRPVRRRRRGARHPGPGRVEEPTAPSGWPPCC